MLLQEYKLYLIKAKEDYKKIGNIVCPAFGSEMLFFNHYGLQHIIFKGRFPRSTDEVVSRFNLVFKYYKRLKNVKNINKEEKRIEDKSIVYFWTIHLIIGNVKIRIILRRLNNGTLHFFSIMDE